MCVFGVPTWDWERSAGQLVKVTLDSRGVLGLQVAAVHDMESLGSPSLNRSVFEECRSEEHHLLSECTFLVYEGH